MSRKFVSEIKFDVVVAVATKLIEIDQFSQVCIIHVLTYLHVPCKSMLPVYIGR